LNLLVFWGLCRLVRPR